MTTLEIQTNKIRILSLAFLFVLSICAGVALSYYLYLDGQFSLKLVGVLIFAIPIMLFILWFSGKKIIDKKPGLVLDSRGIIDNVSLSEIGIISWSNITKVSIIKHNYSQFLLIYLKNNDSIMSRLSGFKKRIAKNNIEKFGTPFIINISNLKIDNLELLKIIQNKIQTN
ncbi:STM3941 family protein [Flavobacterium sp.]|uniref:STM3941 family protein n=1 Tax=Flavobacterium sp. TaxID=239 RepID=UPI002B4ABA62|nr:STM3941 family protein [Flavobacterium sp.]HLP63124.1 STM3941 family protein [Flavobacterium sp.]